MPARVGVARADTERRGAGRSPPTLALATVACALASADISRDDGPSDDKE